MAYEKIIGVFDSTAHAQAAVNDLVANGVPREAIETYNRQTRGREDGGFWSSLFGGQTTNNDRDVYNRSIEAGRDIVAVHVHERNAKPVMAILERDGAIDIDERGDATAEASKPGARAGDNVDSMKLAREELTVGKRDVGGGRTRLRRYTVEEPVDESVQLRDEKVTLERRPVDRPVKSGEDVFSEKTIEATERHEEPVVSKKARIVEEIALRKQAEERVVNVHDTVRHDEVKVEKTDDSEEARRRGAPGR
ncbi:YsnF/AvaK domain-containing protein [Methylocystis sp. L43]|jgi:uncharacterized protein (TIGR02271 family)|uniref:YsnF/AvaK domain-containing protein n=1 Tax=unclassified Methylocystis TaxID=2625913 RepID=UPI0018C2E323|nr:MULTISPECIES: YsnF/AvaK domain-containing protein [unclassified Methylocystis]MBG0797449.1 YsnF/AvaK domain-containing protein [Methylocystis sp. L43]MBG0805054.1 YsnF/AvaK domain-containing protein [Methylocystis sp. H15]